mgnify:CR=1 FL=1
MKRSEVLENVKTDVADVKKRLPIGSVWQHFKSGVYEVVGLSVHTETLEVLVLYRRLDDKFVWARPARMWTPDRFIRINE